MARSLFNRCEILPEVSKNVTACQDLSTRLQYQGLANGKGSRTGSRRRGRDTYTQRRIHGHTRAYHRSIDPIIYRTRNHRHRHHRHHQYGHHASLSEVAICHYHKTKGRETAFHLSLRSVRETDPATTTYNQQSTVQNGEADEGRDSELPSQE